METNEMKNSGVKDEAKYEQGIDDYTYRNEAGPQSSDPDYVLGWEKAEKASKNLAWNYLNYP